MAAQRVRLGLRLRRGRYWHAHWRGNLYEREDHFVRRRPNQTRATRGHAFVPYRVDHLCACPDLCSHRIQCRFPFWRRKCIWFHFQRHLPVCLLAGSFLLPDHLPEVFRGRQETHRIFVVHLCGGDHFLGHFPPKRQRIDVVGRKVHLPRNARECKRRGRAALPSSNGRDAHRPGCRKGSLLRKPAGVRATRAGRNHATHPHRVVPVLEPHVCGLLDPVGGGLLRLLGPTGQGTEHPPENWIGLVHHGFEHLGHDFGRSSQPQRRR